MLRRSNLLIAITLLAIAAASANPSAQSRRPLPSGNQITAQDGDTVVLQGDARVRIIRHRDAVVRVVFSSAERWVILLADFVVNGKADGVVDMSYRYADVKGDWPMEARWQGRAVVSDYVIAPDGRTSLGFTGPSGLIRFVQALHRKNLTIQPRSPTCLSRALEAAVARTFRSTRPNNASSPRFVVKHAAASIPRSSSSPHRVPELLAISRARTTARCASVDESEGRRKRSIDHRSCRSRRFRQK